MKDKTSKSTRLGKDVTRSCTRETARARYEGLNDSDGDPLLQGESLVEAKIRLSMLQGDFDDLPGKGKPLEKDSYHETPEHLRLGYHMLKNAGFLPEEVRLCKEIDELKDQLRLCTDSRERQRLQHRLTEATQQFNQCMEYNRSFRKSLY